MAKYEIMLILDPKEDIKVAEKLTHDVFKNANFTKLDRTELAYEINKSKTATYVLVETDANGDDVKEFIRKANIMKTVWRHLVVNLDKENGREEAAEKMAAKRERDKAAREEAAQSYKEREKEGN